MHPLKQVPAPGVKPRRSPERLSGPARAEVYAVLVGTGLRFSELAQLKVGDLHLDARVPGFDVRADIDKAGRPRYLPLKSDLVDLLRRVTAGRKPSELVFQIPYSLIQRFNADLARAGIPKVDDRGYRADIHSLRKTFGTWLAKAGVHPKVTQELMRHSDIKITMDLYTDPALLDLSGAVGALPMMHQIMHQPGVLCGPECPPMSATGHKVEAS
jgi:integrase